jgi:hypothetical protein
MRRPTGEEEAPRCSLVKTLNRTCTGDEDRALVRSDPSSRQTSGDLYEESIPTSKDDFASFLSQNLDAGVGKPITYQKIVHQLLPRSSRSIHHRGPTRTFRIGESLHRNLEDDRRRAASSSSPDSGSESNTKNREPQEPSCTRSGGLGASRVSCHRRHPPSILPCKLYEMEVSSTLIDLILENNNLTGAIPEDHFASLMNLNLIDLSCNNLEFTINSHWYLCSTCFGHRFHHVTGNKCYADGFLSRQSI